MKIKTSPRTVFVAALVSVLVGASVHRWMDPDIWGHLLRGQLILETGEFSPSKAFLSPTNPVNHYWLFQTVAAGIYKAGGAHGITILFTILWLAIFSLLLKQVPPQKNFVASLWLIAGFFICETRFLERPEVFSFLLASVEIWILRNWADSKRLRTLISLIIIQILWANLHGYFLLGPCLVGLWVMTNLLSQSARKPSPLFLAFPFVLILTSAVSPFGLHTWARVVEQWSELSHLRQHIIEVRPITLETLAYWPYPIFAVVWVGTLAGILYHGLKFRRIGFATALAVVGLWVSRSGLRMSPFLFLFGAPLWGDLVSELSGWETDKKWKLYEARATAAFSMALFLFAGTFPSNLYYRWQKVYKKFGIGVSYYTAPIQLGEYLDTHPVRAPIFNVPSDGSYLKFKNRRLELYADSLMTGAEATERYINALNDTFAFDYLDEKHNFQTVILNFNYGFEIFGPLVKRSQWRLQYANLHSAVLTKDSSLMSPMLPKLYNGEDLRETFHASAIVNWADALAKSGRRSWMIQFLSQLDASPTIPAPVFETVLAFAVNEKMPELLVWMHNSRSRAFGLSDVEAANFDEAILAAQRSLLLRQAL